MSLYHNAQAKVRITDTRSVIGVVYINILTQKGHLEVGGGNGESVIVNKQKTIFMEEIKGRMCSYCKNELSDY